MRTLLVLISVILFTACGKERVQNTAPIADFTIRPSVGTVETTFVCDASGSSDQEDSLDVLRFRWDWESDLIWDTEWLDAPIHSKRFMEPGVYQITLEVSDIEGLTDKGYMSVDVNQYIVIDLRDSRQYKTVRIGNQLWMAQNLNFETETGSWCHSNLDLNCDIYGKLYTWYAAQSACPAGWRLPNTTDWDQLIAHVGSDPGDQLRADFGWNAGHNGNNSSGFTALPGCYRSAYGSFSALGSYAYFWESDENSATSAWSRLFSYNRSDIERNYLDKGNAFSVRCIKITGE